MIKSDKPFKLKSSKDSFRKLKILIYGPSGTGKTILVGSAAAVPVLCPVLGTDIEGGMTSLASYDYGEDTIDLTDVNSFTEGAESYMRVHKYLTSKENTYATAIMDSATELQQMVLDECLIEARKKEPDLHIWNRVTSKMRKAVRQIRDLPIHVLVTALERQVKDETKGIMVRQPALQGKISEEMPGFFDIVGKMEIKKNKAGEVVRILHFESDGSFVAKDRTGALGKKMENPTMEKIWNLIREKHKLD